jgi:hypothetical protein
VPVPDHSELRIGTLNRSSGCQGSLAPSSKWAELPELLACGVTEWAKSVTGKIAADG